MTDASKRETTPEDPFSAWMRLSSDFMGAMARMWSPPGGKDAAPEKKSGGTDALLKIWETQMRTWAALQKGFEAPENLDAAAKLFGTLPDLSLRLMQTTVNGVSRFQARWAQRLAKTGETTGGYDFSDLDPEFLNRWTETYVQEFQQFLRIPQLGLTRFHQERFNHALDRYNLFQAAVNEFLHLFAVPVSKSVEVLQTQLAEMAEQGTLPEDPRGIYRLWIRILEGHYMTLFQSPEYTAALGKAVKAMNEFLSARQEAVETVLKLVPLPTQKELDELYRELYLLKKRVRELEDAARRRGPAEGR